MPSSLCISFDVLATALIVFSIRLDDIMLGSSEGLEMIPEEILKQTTKNIVAAIHLHLIAQKFKENKAATSFK